MVAIIGEVSSGQRSSLHAEEEARCLWVLSGRSDALTVVVCLTNIHDDGPWFECSALLFDRPGVSI
jgi:hypothetical protein